MVIDTNVILRYLLRDDTALFMEASRVMESGEQLLITDVTLMECAYVMGGTYGKKRDQIAKALTALLALRHVSYKSGLADQYLKLYEETPLDLADCYLIAYALKKQTPLKTFDKKMQRIYRNLNEAS